MKIFMSLSSIFKSLAEKKISLADLSGCKLIVGPHREAIMPSDAITPAFLLSYNREKPRHVEGADYVSFECLDDAVFEKWKEVRAAVLLAHKELGIEWTDGRNYPGKALPLLQSGHEVFFDGHWLKPDELQYLLQDEKGKPQ